MARSAPGATIGNAIMRRHTIMVGFDGPRRALAGHTARVPLRDGCPVLVAAR